MKKKRLIYFIPILLSVFIIRPLFAAGAVVFDDITDSLEIGDRFEYIEDPEKKLTITDVSKKDLKWSASASKSINFGFNKSAFWFRFIVINKTNDENSRLFEIDYPMIDYIEFYSPDINGGYKMTNAGDHYPFYQRKIIDRNFIFRLNREVGTHEYFIRVVTTSSINFKPSLWTHHAFEMRKNAEMPVFWIYYGIMIVMAVFNFFIYFSVKKITYIYISLLTSVFILMQLILNGLAFQYLWPDSIWWENNCLPFFISLTILFADLFFRSFVNIPGTFPRVDKFFLYVLMPLTILAASLSLMGVYRFSIILATGIAGVSVILLLLGWFLLVRHTRAGRFLIIAFSFLAAGALFYIFKTFGIMPTNLITNSSMQIGSAMAVVLLSLSLADDINVMKNQLVILNVDLEKKVDERTHEMMEANTKLQDLDRLKSGFFANVSHEIRTPLTMILSPIESAIQGDYGDKIDKKFLENIQRNAIRLLRLVNSLLDFSKIEAGRMTMKVKEGDIVKFMKNYVGLVQPVADTRALKINFSSDSERINLFFDFEKMDKIMMNLFSNALKFTDEGGCITVTMGEDDSNCIIKYHDTGVGIPPDKIGIIFDRFSQAESGPTRKYGGTGIGLALAKEYAEMHGGTITVSSKFAELHPDDHGSVFTVKIPKGKNHFEGKDSVFIVTNPELDKSISGQRFVGMRELAELKAEKTDEPAEEVIPKNGPTTHILIVEDNSDMRNFLKHLLERYYVVHLAENGEEGLKKAADIKPDLIVTDVMMPIMNGYEMTRLIKKNSDLRQIPVIILTAKAELTNKIEGLEYGADDYLTKPFNSKELYTRIGSLLKMYEYQKALTRRNQDMESDLEIARSVMEKLLPERIPDIPGYRTHATYIPIEKVGGDFYDMIVRGNIIEFFIADVSGHGLAGALIALITKMALDGVQQRISPAGVLRAINDVICKTTVKSNYVTSFFAELDTETNIIKYSGAGHIPPILFRPKTDEFIELKARGNPLGWFESVKLEDKETLLEPGDRVIMYTDGITECRNSEGVLFGEERLMEYTRKNYSMPPDEFSARLLEDLKAFSGSDTFSDDLTLIVFDVNPAQ